MKKTIKIFIIQALTIVSVFSTLTSQNRELPCYVDFAQFRHNNEYTKLEVYYAAERSFLRFDAEENAFHAELKITLDILKDNEIVIRDSMILPDKVQRLTDIAPGQKLTYQSVFIIKEGDYTLHVTFKDLKSSTTERIEKKLPVRNFAGEQLRTSDIEIANKIEGIQQEQIVFDKNGLRIFPNPQLYYGGRNSVLNFYMEIYNLAYNPEEENKPYTIRYAIEDLEDNLVKYLGKKDIEKSGSSSTLNGGIDISTLNTGSYYLKLMLHDPQKKETTEAKKIFFVQSVKDLLPRISAPPPESNPDAINNIEQYNHMTEYELNNYYGPLRTIATKEENQVFDQLDTEGKKSFLVEFWKRRDSNPNTPGNEYKAEFLERVEEANELFSTARTEGWKTDRGKVILRYGKPSQVERFPGSASGNAYEIWHYYEIQGGVIFVFVDKVGVKQYELVHSTCQGEIYDSQWNRWLIK